MRLRVLAAAALVIVALWPAVPAWAAACAPIVDPGNVLAASSRLDGAVAALERVGIAASVVVHEGELPASSPQCADSTELAGSVVVQLTPDPWRVRGTAGGSLPQELGERARDAISGRLSISESDAASAVAHGLELVWQVQDGRDIRRLPELEEARVEVQARQAVGVPGPWLSLVVSRILVVLMLVGGAVAAIAIIVRGVRRHQALQALRCAAQAARTDLAERYVDLDSLVATIVMEIEKGAVLLHDVAAAQVREVAAGHSAAVEAAGARAGAALLSTSEPLGHASRAECEEVVNRCGEALVGLEDAVRLLAQSLGSTHPSLPGDPRRTVARMYSWPAADRAS